MTVNKMPKTKSLQKKMTVDKMALANVTVAKMAVNYLTIDKMTIDKMTMGKMACCLPDLCLLKFKHEFFNKFFKKGIELIGLFLSIFTKQYIQQIQCF
jgi:hypothetical protein